MRVDIENISVSQVTGFCIKYDLYTFGTNKEYGRMLNMCEIANHASDVYTIAYDIVMHSEMDNLHECVRCGDGSIHDNIEGIANRILNGCTTYKINLEETDERRF